MPTTKTDLQNGLWMAVWERDVKFTAELRERLQDGRPCARLLERRKIYARIWLAQQFMADLDIVPTQHTAFAVMKKCFNVAARTSILDDRFAVPGRRAVVKYAPEAKEKLERHAHLTRRYGEVYKWFEQRVPKATAAMQRSLDAQRELF